MVDIVGQYSIISDMPVSLVTGACGFTGSHMVETLVRAGHHVRATDLAEAYEKDDPERGRFPGVLKKLGVTFVPANLTHLEEVPRLLEGVDFVFHVAAIFSYSAPWELLHRVNVEGTRHLCEAILAHRKSARLVCWGAGGVYATLPPGRMLRVPIAEGDPEAPINKYLRSKWEQEQSVLERQRTRGLKASLLRPFTVYGPRGVYGGAQMILHFAKAQRPLIPKNFTARLPFSHVEDVCRAALFIAERDDTIGEIYNIVDDSAYSLAEFIRIVASFSGHRSYTIFPVPIWLLRQGGYLAAIAARWISLLTHKPPLVEYDAIKLVGVDHWYSNAKLKNLGFQLNYPDAGEGLRQTIDWYKKEGWL